MKAKLWKELAILIAVFLAIWVAFIFIPFRPAPPEDGLSFENEQEIGEMLIEGYLEDVDLVQDTLVNEAVHKIYNRLLSGLDTTEYDYQIYVINNDHINAFASLGGKVVIFSGLLSHADTPEEVAAVLAHEMGHVEHRHVVNKLVKELGITIVLSVLSGGDPGFIQDIIQQSLSTVFDRSQESEADDFGLQLLENSYIHPNALASIFRKIRDEYGNPIYDNLEFLSTHPNTNKRIKKSLEYEVEEGFQSRPFDDINWEEIQYALK